MTDQNPEPVRTGTSRAIKIALVGAGIAAGAIGATALGASAATNTTSGSGYSAASGSTAAPAAPGAPGNAANQHSATPVRSDEKAVSSSIAATLKAKALAAVPGGTVYRVETDAGDAAYEVHMTKADGSAVTVKFDENLNETKVETGMGQGDPAPANGAGAPHGAPDGSGGYGH